MNLFDFLFPQQAAASHLREIREQQRQANEAEMQPKHLDAVRDKATTDALKMRIDDLENDMGFVVLVLGSLLSAIEEKGVVTRADVERELNELDLIDGKRNGKMSVRILKQCMAKAGQ